MLNIMTKDPNFVSVRLPDDVANWLREYATANKLIRADKPNMGGSIIAVIRSVKSGQTISNNVGQSSAAPDVDIQAMINNAVESRLEAVLSQVESLRLDVHSVQTNDLITQNLQANLTVAQQKIEALEATVSGKKSHLQLVKDAA
jgi:ABC-type phosphate transport system auxiliary subunit